MTVKYENLKKSELEYISTSHLEEKLDYIPKKKPNWIRVKSPTSQEYNETKKLINQNNLSTVCEEAACPNIGECWSKNHVTIMILGDICTRKCGFCNIKSGRPRLVDPAEPLRLASAVSKLNLSHVVITSVDRDDLEDGGAFQFKKSILYIKNLSPSTTIEVLIPDFQRKPGALEKVISANPDVLNHNLETVPRLYKTVRRGANYQFSLNLLNKAKKINTDIFTKSGLMVGLGENIKELEKVFDDLRESQVDFVTIGQYLQPSLRHLYVKKYFSPEEFKYIESLAYKKGFLMVSSSPLTRSSYHADEDFKNLKKNKKILRI